MADGHAVAVEDHLVTAFSLLDGGDFALVTAMEAISLALPRTVADRMTRCGYPGRRTPALV
jgi:hypothetical protein